MAVPSDESGRSELEQSGGRGRGRVSAQVPCAAADSGNEVGFWYESTDGPTNRATIPDPPAGGWSVAELGRAPRWRPCVDGNRT